MNDALDTIITAMGPCFDEGLAIDEIDVDIEEMLILEEDGLIRIDEATVYLSDELIDGILVGSL